MIPIARPSSVVCTPPPNRVSRSPRTARACAGLGKADHPRVEHEPYYRAITARRARDPDPLPCAPALRADRKIGRIDGKSMSAAKALEPNSREAGHSRGTRTREGTG